MPTQDRHSSKIKILIADDHAMLRQGIRVSLDREPDFEVVAEACDGEEAVMLSMRHKPDVVLMDIGMPRLGGLEATIQIKAACPATAVLVLTIHDHEEYIIRLLKAGANGYLMKSSYGQELSRAIRSVVSGDMVLHPTVGLKLIDYAASSKLRPVRLEGIEELTTREVEVLKLVGKGVSNQNIALELGIHIRTVKGHLVSIFDKMGVGSRTEAVVHALERGIITLEEII